MLEKERIVDNDNLYKAKQTEIAAVTTSKSVYEELYPKTQKFMKKHFDGPFVRYLGLTAKFNIFKKINMQRDKVAKFWLANEPRSDVYDVLVNSYFSANEQNGNAYKGATMMEIIDYTTSSRRTIEGVLKDAIAVGYCHKYYAKGELGRPAVYFLSNSSLKSYIIQCRENYKFVCDNEFFEILEGLKNIQKFELLEGTKGAKMLHKIFDEEN
jgi:hypothetical protein